MGAAVERKRREQQQASRQPSSHTCNSACSGTEYRLEEILVSHFIECIAGGASPWGEVQYVREFDFQRGRPDVVIVREDESVVAVEAKLKRWRDALYQATRNRSFAQNSYVLLPRHVAVYAQKHLDEFRQRNVGLCYIDCNDSVTVLFEPQHEVPLEPWIYRAATKAARDVRQSA